MPENRVAVWDSGDKWDQPGLVWGPLAAQPEPPILIPKQNLNLNLTTNMEYWEITLDRAQKTLPVWQQYVPALTIASKTPATLETLIDGFQPLVSARVEAQDAYDAAFRAVQSSLLKLKLLGTKLPVIIEIQLPDNAGILKDVDDLYRVNPRTESAICKRATMLLPVWEAADAALAAQVPPHPPLTLNIQAVPHTAAMLEALITGLVGVKKTLEQKSTLLDVSREALRAHDRTCDRLNKDWYRYVKQTSEAGAPVLTALEGIPTEPSTPLPEVIEIETVTQGGEEGLQALIAYVPGGGAHATTKKVKWGVSGIDTGTPHEAVLDLSGNALGPFAVGQVVTILTEVSNSAGTRTTAPRTITIEEPIG